jgi:hypothetical protein
VSAPDESARRPARGEAGNPFATRHIRPGAGEYLFPPGVWPEQLIQRLRANEWWGQIVGSHGSGKSALVAVLVPLLRSAGRNVAPYALRRGQRRLPTSEDRSAAPWDAATQVIVDGYEQLSWWSRRWLASRCRRHGAGLLITTHHPVGLPELFTTRLDEAAACAVVARLMRGRPPVVGDEDVRHAFARHGGNLRETLLELYDAYEARTREMRD